jgi:hypothetical protein
VHTRQVFKNHKSSHHSAACESPALASFSLSHTIRRIKTFDAGVVPWLATLKTFYHFIRHIILFPTNTHIMSAPLDTFSFGRGAHWAPELRAKSEPPGPGAHFGGAPRHLCAKNDAKNCKCRCESSCITGALASSSSLLAVAISQVPP